jgi:ribosomal protein S18 acetylase RimI-like enzyme
VPTLKIRPATPADIPAVLAFWQHAAEDAHRPADSAGALEALLARDPGALLLAVDATAGATADDSIDDLVDDLVDDSGVLVGSVIAGWDGWRCHIYRLAVAESQRRRGIGRALIDAAEARFRAFGGARADAMVLDDNALAHHAWSARGYAPQTEWSRWVKPL